jgi:hypothetical protein
MVQLHHWLVAPIGGPYAAASLEEAVVDETSAIVSLDALLFI